MTIDRRSFVRNVAGGAAAIALLPRLADAADLTSIQREVDKRQPEALDRLRDWIKQATIFAEGTNIQQGADYMAKLAKDAGFTSVTQIKSTKTGAPVVFGRLDAGAKRTLGLYFMYDVKQVNEREWSSPPFEAKLVDHPEHGKIVVGRGAVNQKGPEATFLAALHAIRGAGKKLPVNLVLLAEGEEEVSSESIGLAVKRPEVQKAFAKCQGVMMPSALQNADGTIEIALGAKGIVEIELVASAEKWGRGSKRDVHSSLAAAVDSPVWHLVHALDSLVTADGEPAIDGLMQMMRPLTAKEKALIADQAKYVSEAAFKNEIAVGKWRRDMSYADALERLASYPTVNIEGIVAGYGGPAGKTILPHEALAKVDIRIVPDMTVDKVIKALRGHLDKRGFKDIEIRDLGSVNSNTTSVDSLLIKAEVDTYRARKLEPIITPRAGGTWPGYMFTDKPLSLPAGHFGLGYGAGAHGKDEFFIIESKDPKIEGMVGATKANVEFLYKFAEA